MKKLKVFDTYENYENAELKYPNVSFIESIDEVRFKEYHYYYKDYLTTTALTSGTITFTIGANINQFTLSYISYSLDNGETWVNTQNTGSNRVTTITTPTLEVGDKVLWKGSGGATATQSSTSKFSSTCQFDVSGNILSLLYGNDFVNLNLDKTISNTFNGLFKNCTNLHSAENLILYFSNQKEYCYNEMFMGSGIEIPPKILKVLNNNAGYVCHRMFYQCTNLIKTPYMVIESTGRAACQQMFEGCTSLTTIVKFEPTVVGQNGFQTMFMGCSNLEDIPSILPPLVLARRCYYGMFAYCPKIKRAPDLPARIVASECYGWMFNRCESLEYIKVLCLDPSSSATQGWVTNITTTGKIVINSACDPQGSWWTVSYPGSTWPSTWTVETDSSKIPITFRSASDSKTFDGVFLTNDTITTIGFLEEGDTVTFDVTGIQTLVGESQNTFTYEFNVASIADKYSVTTEFGTLTVVDGTNAGEEPLDPNVFICGQVPDSERIYTLGQEVEFTIHLTNIYDSAKTIRLHTNNAVRIVSNKDFINVAPGATVIATGYYTITENDVNAEEVVDAEIYATIENMSVNCMMYFIQVGQI